MATRRRVLAFLLPLLLALAFARAGAGEVPESALSRGSLVRPEFLDSEGQVFLYPQRAAGFDAQLFGMNTGGSSSVTVGGLARAGRHGIFFLGQPAPQRFPGSTQYYQAGYAIGAGPFRLGAALRGSYRTEGSGLVLDNPEVNREHYRREEWKGSEKTLEGAVGIGFRAGRWTLDLALERRTEVIESRSEYRDEQNDLPYHYLDDRAFEMETRVDPAWEGASRLSVRIGDGAEVLATGSYARPEYEIDGYARWDSIEIDLSEKERSHVWSGGLAVCFPTEHLDRVTLFSFAKDYLTYETTSNYSYQTSRVQYRKAWIGAAVEREMFRNLTARAGIEGRYERRVDRSYRFYNLESRIETDDRESFGEGYSWGASYRWRNVRLHGVVSASLGLSYIFSALDVHIYF